MQNKFQIQEIQMNITLKSAHDTGKAIFTEIKLYIHLTLILHSVLFIAALSPWWFSSVGSSDAP